VFSCLMCIKSKMDERAKSGPGTLPDLIWDPAAWCPGHFWVCQVAVIYSAAGFQLSRLVVACGSHHLTLPESSSDFAPLVWSCPLHLASQGWEELIYSMAHWTFWEQRELCCHSPGSAFQALSTSSPAPLQSLPASLIRVLASADNRITAPVVLYLSQ
jgi:hypothetical protein